jgi:8-oxo-dGTP pyrophosphatase MutT (NUDIX family)
MSEDWFSSARWLDSPRHVVAVAAVVLDENGKLLLVKSPRRGWEIPGGQVELAESIRDAAVREVREESGIVVELLEFCGIFQNVPKGVCAFLFTAKPTGGALAASEESLEVGWYPPIEALEMVTRQTMRRRIELVLASPSKPFFVEHGPMPDHSV